MQNIILLHGALGSHHDLESLSDALKQQGFSVHSFSFSGHGGSAFAGSFGIPQFAEELKDYIQKNELQPAAVFGYSMGGFVALHLAAQKPELIYRIITLGTKFNWSPETVEKETSGLNPEKMEEKIPAFAKALEARHGAAWKESVIKTEGLMREIGEKQFLSPEILKTIQMPVLLGLGDRDKMVTLQETTGVYKTLPQAAMYMLPKTKHPIETANAELVSAVIADFLK